MKYIYSIIKADYLQRTRSYAFLITLAVTLFAAYSFVPPPTASYTTLDVAGYKGVYNSAWVGHVSAMMTTIMLSLYGFFLIIGGIKKDIDTELGLIIATTPITNFAYLLSKTLSNYFVLLTIAGITFVVSLIMFFVRSSGYPSILSDFVIPYLLLALPSLFIISTLAVVAEVYLGKSAILQYIVFVLLFGVITANVNGLKNNTVATLIDPFGVRTMTTSIKNQINTQFHENIQTVSFGFIFNRDKKPFKSFIWNGVKWTTIFLLSRLLWIGFVLGLLYISSFFFHRFDFKQSSGKQKKILVSGLLADVLNITTSNISRASLPPVITDYSIFPFIKTELLLLIRMGSKWYWLIIAGLWVSLFFAPLQIAHTYLLAVIWFLQVTRWSDLSTKEKTNRLHYFTYSSYKPLMRMLPAQLFAGVILAVALSLPLVVRYIISLDVYSIINIFNGAVFLVLLALCLGILSGGKKLFEIVFFMLTYMITQKIPFADYFGGVKHNNMVNYIAIVLMLNVFLGVISFSVRSYQVRHL